jgi:outer membrane protein assembly factor BamB
MRPLKKSIPVLFACVVLAIAAEGATRECEWGRWRGPNGNGITEDSNWSFSALANGRVVWTNQVGAGYSSVAVCGNSVYTLGNSEGKDTVHCLDAHTGARRWVFSYDCKRGSYAGPRSTPVVSDGNVYVVSRDGEVHCIAAETGASVWKVNITSEFGARNPRWDHSGSVLIEKDILVLNANVAGIALDKRTGGKVWASDPGMCGYSTPVPYDASTGRAAVLFGEKAVMGVDLKTGRKLWSSEWVTSWDVNASDPVVSGNKVFITTGYGKGCELLDVSGESPVVVWANKGMASHFSSPVLVGGHLYGISGDANRTGSLVCLDFATGTTKWSQPAPFGSLICADGKLVLLSDEGSLSVVEATPAGHKELVKSPSVLSKTCWTSPVLCKGMIFCRNNEGTLVAVDVKRSE